MTNIKINIYSKQQQSQKWIDIRTESKEVRAVLTSAINAYIQSHACTKTYKENIYSNVTDTITIALFNRRPEKLKEEWECRNPRDKMNIEELKFIIEAETLITRLILQADYEPLTASREAMNRLILPFISR
jgi:hypothetical protein